MPFLKGHQEYRTAKSFVKLSETMRVLFAGRWLEKFCKNCGAYFRIVRSMEKDYCSVRCSNKCPELRKLRGERQSGENAPNWKGGISPLRTRINMSARYKEWRKFIFVRDNYTCQQCGTQGVELQVDHFKKSFSKILSENNIHSVKQADKCDELWDTNNGRTLCLPCHFKTVNYGAKANLKSCPI